MSEDVTSLVLKVESGEVSKARVELERLTGSGKGAESAAGSIASAFRGLAAQAAGIISVTAALHKLVDTARTFEVLGAALHTVTGSAENATIAMDAIKQFASTTPYSVEQSTQAFIRLVSTGLDPSEKALRAYGNTASAMGKDLGQYVEAVADATIGQYIRLRDFGIDASKQGDNVAFRFRGITTTVKNDSEEIQKYLQKIGEVDFAGAMERRAATIDGALSNLGDSWDQLFDNINKSGTGKLMADSIWAAVDAVNTLSSKFASGELPGYIKAIGISFDGVAKDIPIAFGIAQTFLTETFAKMGNDGKASASDIRGAFINIVPIIRAATQEATVSIASLIDERNAKWKEFAKTGVLPSQQTDDNTSQELKNRLAAIQSAKDASMKAFQDEQNAAIKATETQIQAAQKLRGEYEKLQAEKAKSGGDALGQFKIAGDGKPQVSDEERRASARKVEQAKKDFAQLQEQLRSEEETIRESHRKRQEIITANTEEGSAIRAELTAKNDAAEVEALRKYNQEKVDAAYEGLMSEEEMIQKAYDRKKELILDAEKLTEEEKTNLMNAAEEQRTENLQKYREQQEAIQSQYWGNTYSKQLDFEKRIQLVKTQSGAAQLKTVVGTLVAMTEAGAQHSRALFEINKIATIAQIALDTPKAVSGAYAFGAEIGGPYLGAAFGAIALAAEAAQMAAAMSTSFGGGGHGTTPSAAGTTPVVNSVPVAPSSSNSSGSQSSGSGSGNNYFFYGDVYSNDAQRLFNDIRTMINDEDLVLIENTSRQAGELK